MSIRGTMLFIGIVVTAAAALLGHPFLIFAIEVFWRLAAAALLSVVAA